MDESASTIRPESKHKKKANPEPEQLRGNEEKTVDPEANRIFV